MWTQTCRNFLIGVRTLAVFAGLGAGLGLASNHHVLNGTWQLVPARSELHGEAAIQTGTVTINDREGNIYVERNFNFDDGCGRDAIYCEQNSLPRHCWKSADFQIRL